MGEDMFLESLKYQAIGEHREKKSVLGPAPKTPAERREMIRLGGSLDNETYYNGPDEEFEDEPNIAILQQGAHLQIKEKPVLKKLIEATRSHKIPESKNGLKKELEEISNDLESILSRLDSVIAKL